jgi:hypothetical protein
MGWPGWVPLLVLVTKMPRNCCVWASKRFTVLSLPSPIYKKSAALTARLVMAIAGIVRAIPTAAMTLR